MTPIEKKYIKKLEDYNKFLKKVYLLRNKPDSLTELFELEIITLEKQVKEQESKIEKLLIKTILYLTTGFKAPLLAKEIDEYLKTK